MTEATGNNEELLEHAHQLVALLEQGNMTEADKVLDAMSVKRESSLFQELGKLTRELHDTLNNFQLDTKFAELTETDIPDAKERLAHVIDMTEQAADKTLTAVENTIPICDELVAKGNTLKAAWERFRTRDMEVEEFRELSRELDSFFEWLGESAPTIQARMTEILMAQDFQDLTGQIIRRVINLVQDVEGGLVDLIRITGSKIAPVTPEKKKESDERDIEAVGPVVPGVDKGDVVSNQDDVDDLLSSLGF